MTWSTRAQFSRQRLTQRFIAYHIARERLQTKTAEEAVNRACRKLEGAYSLVVMSPRKLIGARDPYGFKPLCIGKRENSYIITSESCALDTIGAEFVRDVLPGETVTITPDGMGLFRICRARCLKIRKQDVFLSISILQDLTARLMVSASIRPGFKQGGFLLRIALWRRIWW